MHALDCGKELCIHRLDAGAIYSLNRALHLTLVYFLQCIKGVIRDLGARSTLPLGFGGRLGRSVRRCLVRGSRLLIDAIFGENIVQIGALRRVVDDFERLLQLAADQDRLGDTTVQP